MKRALPVLVVLLAAGCGDSDETPTGPSSIGSASHNAGRNCLDCHSFSVAGTAYSTGGATPAPGTVIRLTREPGGQGEVVLTLTADASGNFYTTETVAFGTGLYAAAEAASGAVRFMQTALDSGGCNGCHVAGNRIVAD